MRNRNVVKLAKQFWDSFHFRLDFKDHQEKNFQKTKQQDFL